MGILQCLGGHVVLQISSEKSGLPRSRPELPARYRGPDVGDKHAKEGLSLYIWGVLRYGWDNVMLINIQDIVSPNIPALSLPLATLPHIITPSLAMSLLPDILSRLSHSSPVVRKKTIVCLYRLALVYSEALRLAWPKIQAHLMDEEEDASVTTAAINVVCELGWRRPHDFLPLAPRFFELLVDSGNNWMAIKIIKLVRPLFHPRRIHSISN